MICFAYILHIMQSAKGLARFAFELDPFGSWEKVNKKSQINPTEVKELPFTYITGQMTIITGFGMAKEEWDAVGDPELA